MPTGKHLGIEILTNHSRATLPAAACRVGPPSEAASKELLLKLGVPSAAVAPGSHGDGSLTQSSASSRSARGSPRRRH